jgi:CheY-like chemotaxis protein
MVDLIHRTIGEATEVCLFPGGTLWLTHCDANQLESSILNLVINARDAMPDGGQLTIETRNAHFDKPLASQMDVAPGDYICVAVSDTGFGMSDEVMAQAFEPFFTTKPAGQGTGLGLSMIYGFARQSEGYTRLYSELDHGTTVKMYLPRYHGDQASTMREDHREDARPARPGGVVLVVEDDETVRALVADVLDELGYVVLQASDGLAGLAILQSGQRVDLLLTDIGLPGLNGRQLADDGLKTRPNLKILLMTGYAENAASANGFLKPGMQLITKPFALDVLADRVTGMIEA